jgi:hypothetical protein
MRQKLQLFGLLWVLGLTGEVTLLWADLPLPPEPLPLPLSTVKGLMLLQGMVMVTIAVALGVVLAPRVQLSAPWLEAIAQGRPLSQRSLKPPLVWGAIGGVVSASLALLWLAGWQPALPPEFLTAAKTYQLPLFARILRGGISEEILMRWGLMTLLVWLPWRMVQRQRDRPLHPGYYIAALSLTAVIFGGLHLPLAFLLSPTITIALLVYIIGANAIVGAIAGYLYWQVGLEAAIIAHALFHVLVAIVESWGWV